MTVIRGATRFVVEPAASLSSQLPESVVADLRAPLLRMDRLCALSVTTVARLLTEHPSLRSEVSGDDVAIVVGTAHGCHKTDEEYYQSYLQGQPSPRLFAYTLPSSPIGELSIFYRLRGPGLALCSGRASGLLALAEAENLLCTRQAAACLVLAVEVAGAALSSSQLSDAAVALWLVADHESLDPSLPRLVSTTESYVADDPSTAIAHVLATAAGSTVVADAETSRLAGSALSQRVTVADAPDGSVAGLWRLVDAIAAAQVDPSARVACVVADPSGQAAAVTVNACGTAPKRL